MCFGFSFGSQPNTPHARSIIKDAIVAPTLTKNALIVMFWTMLYATRACLVGVFVNGHLFNIVNGQNHLTIQ